ncbi:MAG: MBL fold metallo-hydrolase [Oscillospiraceae bacterium]|nr:MBL fold metallo-hydrolase [Oscillospiraceae bacterium]
MPGKFTVTYLAHSGFALQLEDTLLVFDDARGTPPEGAGPSEGYITKETIAAQQRTVYFVSHSHGDHFNPAIYDNAQAASVYYVLGDDLPDAHSGIRLSPGQSAQVGGAHIEAFASTDQGVSFLITIDGYTIFHAGDLNLWHWRQESTPKEVEQAEREYIEAVTPLIGREIDLAFFPLDPRMGEMYDAGAQHFIMHVRPHVLIPMHFWDRADVPEDFARRNRTRHVEVLAMTQPGQSLTLLKDEAGQIVINPQG